MTDGESQELNQVAFKRMFDRNLEFFYGKNLK